MNIPGLVTPFRAGGAIGKRRLVIHGAADGVALQAAATTALLIGVTTDIPAASGETVDVIRDGLADVEYGGTVARGAFLTSDSVGRAVAVTLPVAAGTYVIGTAEVAGVLGDIGSVAINPNYLVKPGT